MATMTFDRGLASAEALTAEEQSMLAELLHHRRIEAWRKETAAEAVAATKAFRSGKLKSGSADSILARLRVAK